MYLTVDKYQKDTTEGGDSERREFSWTFLDGVKRGLIGFNTQLKMDGKAPYFCLPGTPALTRQQAEDIMLRWVKDYPEYRTAPIDLTLLRGLVNTFPCKKTRPAS